MRKLPTLFPAILLFASLVALVFVPGCGDDCTCPPQDQTPDGWFALTSVPTTLDLTVVRALDVNTIVAAGDSGLVLRSADGGESWTTIETPTESRFVYMSFVDAAAGWLSGEDGALIHTTDGGRTWEALDPGMSGDLNCVFFVTPELGWIGGGPWPEQDAAGMLGVTENGGETWTTFQTAARVNVLFAVDSDTVCAGLSDGSVLRTTDRGQTWHVYPSDAPGWLGGIWFPDPLTGWLAGAGGALIKSEDGGMIWVAAGSGTTRNLVDVYFQDPQTGWAVGQLGTVLKTTNSGATWTYRTSGTTAHLRMIDFADADTGWIVGLGGVILKTVTAGEPRIP
jgi:photosystem II stability/assembly factor-like uncharacterized protein